MAKLFRMSDYRKTCSRRPVYFDQHELRRLLDLYSRRVVTGEWRDYAIDHRNGIAVFSIFRHTRDAPLFRVAKVPVGSEPQIEYHVLSGPQRVKSASSIDEALAFLNERRPMLVT